MSEKWLPSQYPSGSFHLDLDTCGARIRPIPHIGFWEWSSWIGPPKKRVLHERGELKSKASAKKAALKSCQQLLGKKTPTHTRFALEIDSQAITRDVNLTDELPHGARVLHGPEWEAKARIEFARGRTYRAPAQPIYLVIEWTGRHGEIGRLIDFLEDPRFPIVRYAGISE